MTIYKGYRIVDDYTGFAPASIRFSFGIPYDDEFAGCGESIEDCKEQIDELILNKE